MFAASRGNVMESSTHTARPFCCDCIPTQNRCSADSCPCVAARKICDEHCESGKYRYIIIFYCRYYQCSHCRGDCLNQAICKCSCEVEEGNAKSARNACTKQERCDCLRIKEGCSRLCACKQLCKNKEPPKKVVLEQKITSEFMHMTCR